MPRKNRKPLAPPSPDVAAKQTPGFSKGDFEDALGRGLRGR